MNLQPQADFNDPRKAEAPGNKRPTQWRLPAGLKLRSPAAATNDAEPATLWTTLESEAIATVENEATQTD
jgi:hypothetical protein